MKSIVSIAFVIIFLSGCASSTSRGLNELQIGMTKDQVIAKLGSPTSTRAAEGTEFLIYKLLTPGKIPALVRDDYFVRFVNGRVDAFGKVGDFGSTKDTTIIYRTENTTTVQKP